MKKNNVKLSALSYLKPQLASREKDNLLFNIALAYLGNYSALHNLTIDNSLKDKKNNRANYRLDNQFITLIKPLPLLYMRTQNKQGGGSAFAGKEDINKESNKALCLSSDTAASGIFNKASGTLALVLTKQPCVFNYTMIDNYFWRSQYLHKFSHELFKKGIILPNKDISALPALLCVLRSAALQGTRKAIKQTALTYKIKKQAKGLTKFNTCEALVTEKKIGEKKPFYMYFFKFYLNFIFKNNIYNFVDPKLNLNIWASANVNKYFYNIFSSTLTHDSSYFYDLSKGYSPLFAAFDSAKKKSVPLAQSLTHGFKNSTITLGWIRTHPLRTQRTQAGLKNFNTFKSNVLENSQGKIVTLLPLLFKSIESTLKVPAHTFKPTSNNFLIDNYFPNDAASVVDKAYKSTSLLRKADQTLDLSGSLSPFFDFFIDNKGINKHNKLGLRKIFSEFKFYRYFRYSGEYTGTKQIITYSFNKNINRTNSLNSLDHTGSLLKISISVILKYFFNLMGSALISKPIFIFSHNKVIIQISYFMHKKIFFGNRTIKNWNETVSTLSMGMQFFWPIINNNFKKKPMRYLEDSGSYSSLWKMFYYVSSKKSFDDKILPFYPGNLPYLSQYNYTRYAFRKLKLLLKIAKYNKEEDKNKKRKFRRNSKNSKGTHKNKGSNLLNEDEEDEARFALQRKIKLNINGLERLPKKFRNHSQPYVRNTLSFFYKELNILTYILEKFFNCSIKLELNRINTPYSDTNIMAQLIGINGEELNFNQIRQRSFPNFFYCNPNQPQNKNRFKVNKKPFKVVKNNSKFSQVSGFKIRVAGRFYKHRIIPRKTVSVVQRGSLARGVVNLVEKARYTNKSKRGSFSVTV